MDDVDCLGTKILSNVESQFQNDPEIDEYDVVPVVAPTQNRNPVYVVEHKLAIESWGAKLMYCTAAKDLRRWRSRGQKISSTEVEWLISRTMCVLLLAPDHTTAWNIRKELVTSHQILIKDDLSLSKLILRKHPKSPETFALRRWLLSRRLPPFSFGDSTPKDGRRRPTISPDTRNDPTTPSDGKSKSKPDAPSETKDPTSAYRQRSRRLDDDKTTSPNDDNYDISGEKYTSRNDDAVCEVVRSEDVKLRFDDFSENRDVVSRRPSHSDDRHRLVELELQICDRAARDYAGNYNAWSHRIWILQHLACCSYQMITRELEAMLGFVWLHVSDHCGYHYRQFLLTMMSPFENFPDLLRLELQLTSDLISSYPGHEAMWSHRRYVLHFLVGRPGESVTAVGGIEIVTPDDEIDRHVPKRTRLDDDDGGGGGWSAAEERTWCQTVSNECSKTDGGWQATLCQRHIAWINRSFDDVGKCIRS